MAGSLVQATPPLKRRDAFISFAPDARTIDFLTRLAQLYSQRQITPTGTVAALSPNEMLALWRSHLSQPH